MQKQESFRQSSRKNIQQAERYTAVMMQKVCGDAQASVLTDEYEHSHE